MTNISIDKSALDDGQVSKQVSAHLFVLHTMRRRDGRRVRCAAETQSLDRPSQVLGGAG